MLDEPAHQGLALDQGFRIAEVLVRHVDERLATHAHRIIEPVFIQGYRAALDLLDLHRDRAARPAVLRRCCVGAALVLLFQLVWGAYVAGLDAGYVASDWPLMNGRFFPDGVTSQGSWLATLTSDPYLVHFLHRWWAWVVLGVMILMARGAKRAGDRAASVLLNAAIGTQILLGISTVVSGVALWLAVLHQAVGALVVASAVRAMHSIGRRRSA